MRYGNIYRHRKIARCEDMFHDIKRETLKLRIIIYCLYSYRLAIISVDLLCPYQIYLPEHTLLHFGKEYQLLSN